MPDELVVCLASIKTYVLVSHKRERPDSISQTASGLNRSLAELRCVTVS